MDKMLKDNKFHYVYEVIDTINNKRYIGKRTCNCNIDKDNYLGSNKELKEEIKKYGRNKFIKNILAICATEKDASLVEGFYIRQRGAISSEEYYNKLEGFYDYTSKELRQPSLGYHKSKNRYINPKNIIDNNTFLTIYPKDSRYNELIDEVNVYKKIILEMNEKILELNREINDIYSFEGKYQDTASDYKFKISEIKNNNDKKLDELYEKFMVEKRDLEERYYFKSQTLRHYYEEELSRISHEICRLDNQKNVFDLMLKENLKLRDKNLELLKRIYQLENKEE